MDHSNLSPKELVRLLLEQCDVRDTLNLSDFIIVCQILVRYGFTSPNWLEERVCRFSVEDTAEVLWCLRNVPECRWAMENWKLQKSSSIRTDQFGIFTSAENWNEFVDKKGLASEVYAYCADRSNDTQHIMELAKKVGVI